MLIVKPALTVHICRSNALNCSVLRYGSRPKPRRFGRKEVPSMRELRGGPLCHPGFFDFGISPPWGTGVVRPLDSRSLRQLSFGPDGVLFQAYRRCGLAMSLFHRAFRYTGLIWALILGWLCFVTGPVPTNTDRCALSSPRQGCSAVPRAHHTRPLPPLTLPPPWGGGGKREPAPGPPALR